MTEILPAPSFWWAEPEHDRYFARNRLAGYRQVVISPKIAKLRKAFAARLK